MCYYTITELFLFSLYTFKWKEFRKLKRDLKRIYYNKKRVQ
jgi:hypothetical protein